MFNYEKHPIFASITIGLLAMFYGIYFCKMLIQRKQGIKTHQIGTRKEKSIHTVETLMSIATYLAPIVQLTSLGLEWNYMPPVGRYIGAGIALLGDIIFLISVITMKNSWRAGIPDGEKTKLVTNGIYKFSRNPAFLGFDLMYIGIALLYLNPVSIVFSLFPIVMLHLQIIQEEKYLITTFGEEYIKYKQKVFRYFGRKLNNK